MRCLMPWTALGPILSDIPSRSRVPRADLPIRSDMSTTYTGLVGEAALVLALVSSELSDLVGEAFMCRSPTRQAICLQLHQCSCAAGLHARCCTRDASVDQEGTRIVCGVLDMVEARRSGFGQRVEDGEVHMPTNPGIPSLRYRQIRQKGKTDAWLGAGSEVEYVQCVKGRGSGG